ncbi:MAG: type IV pilus assembly protein PilM [Verrucomicrobiota bacterium]
MAGAARVVALDIGTYTIKVAEFQLSGNGQLQINRFGTKELGLDPNKEEVRFPAIASTLQDLMGQTGIKPQPAIMSISGQSVFLRFVKLPPVDMVAVDQMISFEAQQNLPFPINVMVWDYQLMPGRVSGETEAIIVAMKTDLLEGEYRAAETAGLGTKMIDVSPLALYNAFRYNYPTTDDCTLLLDMGARTSNLLFIEGSNLYTRSVPIAGNLLSQNICNDLQEPFVAAETLKKGKGFVSLGGAYADPDDRDAARISKLIRTTMTRLHNDINRSVNFYKTQQGGSAPKRVLLSGGSSQLPYLDVFIAEKLNLEVEYFNPLQNVTLGPGMDRGYLEDNACYAGELVGLALRESGACPMEVSLVPPELSEKRERSRQRPFYFLALVLWLAFFGLLSASNWRQAEIADEMTVRIEKTNRTLQQYQAKTQELAAKAHEAEVEFDAVKKLLGQRDDWADLLDAIHRTLPRGVWVTSMTPLYKGFPLDRPLPEAMVESMNEGAPPPLPDDPPPSPMPPAVTELAITGLYHSHRDTFGLGLDVIETIESNLEQIDAVEAVIEASGNAPTSDDLAAEYEFVLVLKNPISVEP